MKRLSLSSGAALVGCGAGTATVGCGAATVTVGGGAGLATAVVTVVVALWCLSTVCHTQIEAPTITADTTTQAAMIRLSVHGRCSASSGGSSTDQASSDPSTPTVSAATTAVSGSSAGAAAMVLSWSSVCSVIALLRVAGVV